MPKTTLCLIHPSGVSELVEAGSDREKDLRAGGYCVEGESPPAVESEPAEDSGPKKGTKGPKKAAD
jgi:hypothetical protein